MQKLFFVLAALLLTFNLSTNAQQTINNSGLEAVKAQVFRNGRMLTQSEVMNIMKDQPEALAAYQKGLKLRSIGTPMLIGGIIMTVAGVGVMVSGMKVKSTTATTYGSSNIEFSDKYYLGALVSSIGEGLLAGGIICRVMGRSKIKRAVNTYNSNIPENQKLSYNVRVGMQPYGMGLSINF